MKRSGFTIVEVLCVFVILSIMGAILAPVLARSIHSSQETTALQRLKQLHIAFMLYRTDNDGEGKYGTAPEMGLPSYAQYKSGGYRAVWANDELWKPACGIHPSLQDQKLPLFVYPPDESEASAAYYRRNGDNSILLLDENCTAHDTPLSSAFDIKRVVGIRLNGAAKIISTRGYPDSVDNWH
jgi:prepilin-type N-terminal cleavage/methylation domain-containing protein